MVKMQTIIVMSAIHLWAVDSFEDYKKNVLNEYNAYYEKEQKAFESFSQTMDGIPDKINPYQQVNIIPPKPQIVEKLPEIKPAEPIVVKPKVIEKPKNTLPEGTKSGSQIDTVKINDIDPSKLVPPTVITIVPSVVSPKTMALSFYGASLPIRQSSIEFTKTLNVDSKISNLAEEIKGNDVQLITEMKRIRKEYNLNDWDTVLVVQSLMNTLYTSNDQNIKTVHAVDLLRGLGIKTLLGEGDDNHLYFLLASKQQIYSKSFIQRDGNRFYLFSIDAHPRADFKTAINFYRSADDGVGSPVNMVMHKDPKIGNDPKGVILHWDFEKKNYSMSVNVNGQLAALMDMYPQVEYDMYMQSRSGNGLIQNLAHNLKNEIQKNHFNQEQSVAFILRFAQQAFTYKTDFDAYGFERPMFVEQTILLPYSDCEDRAIMLSQLYRETLGMNTVGLQYPGHISLGVDYPGKGDFYTVQDHKFFVTDGTYFYAHPGMSQPSFKNAQAKILLTH